MARSAAEPIGIGLIGVGRHGRRYVEHLMSDVPGAYLVAVCRKRMGEQPDVRFSGLAVYGDYRELIADPSVEAVVVVTDPSLCHDMCLASVEAGKPILIEKPLATTGKDARAMVAAADKAGVLLMTAQTMRFDPTVLLVKQHMPALGPLQRAVLRSHIESGAGIVTRTPTAVSIGVLLEIGVHLLDVVRFLTGEEVKEVLCATGQPHIGAGETTAQASMKLNSGLQCRLDIARVESGRIGSMEWVGREGTIAADWIKRRVVCRIGHQAPAEYTVEAKPTIVAALEAFVHAITTRTQPPVTGLDGCRAVELVDACHESAALGGVAVRPGSQF